MSKRAEEAALKAYPEETRFIRDYSQLAKRQIYQQGYEQAEKDLALTPEDVQTIDDIIVDMTQHTDWPLKGQEAFYGEVLKRFIEKREKK